ncbi:hypothetical protein MBANPS3_002561 [Mucor bainieri]
MADMEEQQHALFKCCQGHDAMVLLSSQYKEFSKNTRKLIDCWFSNEDTLSGEELDTCRLVSVNQRCACALKLSKRLLLEVGLRPAIINITTAIISALFSDDYFGLYQISTMILETSFETVNNLPFLCAIDGLLKKTLKVHHNRLILLFHDKTANSTLSQFLGRGDYSQVSSMALIFRFIIHPNEGSEATLVLIEGDACTKLQLARREPLFIPGGDRPGYNHANQSFELTYRVLAKEEALPLNGINLTFLTRNCRDLEIEFYVSDDSKGGTSQHQVNQLSVSSARTRSQSLCSPVTVKILPMHYSSNLKLVASTVSMPPKFMIELNKSEGLQASFQNGKKNDVACEVEESINVHERLFLRRNYHDYDNKV